MRPTILSTVALAATLLAGCGGSTQSSAGAAPGGAMPQTIAFAEHLEPSTDFTVGIRLNGENPGQSKPYGQVLGYFKGTKAKKSAVVTIPLGSNVVFSNVDGSFPHTGSFLGDASKKSAPWPSSFTGSGTQSKAGTDISTADFSTGTLNAGSSSLVYTANVPGFYMFGCAFHYVSHEMRDIIIVK
jgi:plastocyanin